MRKEIQALLNSDITGYKIAQITGVGESLISNLRNGKRNIDNLSFKNAEKLYDFQVLSSKYADIRYTKQADELEYISTIKTNISDIGLNKNGLGLSIDFEDIEKVMTEEGVKYSIVFKWSDELKVNEYCSNDDILQLMYDNEIVEDIYYFESLDDAEIYLMYNKDSLNIDNVKSYI